MASSRKHYLYRLHLTAFGIMAVLTAVVSWLLVQQGQVHWTLLIENLNPFNPAVAPYVAGSGLNPSSPSTAKIVALGVARQAQMQAFIDLFWFIGWVTFALLPLVFLMKRPQKTGLIVVPA